MYPGILGPIVHSGTEDEIMTANTKYVVFCRLPSDNVRLHDARLS